jgi:hypothetical protein
MSRRKKKHLRPAAQRLPRKPAPKPMLLCLCSTCAQQFYNSPEHRIRRADYEQSIKDLCDFCESRNGWDFLVTNTKG